MKSIATLLFLGAATAVRLQEGEDVAAAADAIVAAAEANPLVGSVSETADPVEANAAAAEQA